MNHDTRKRGFFRFIALVVLSLVLLFIFSDTAKPFLDQYIVDPSKAAWNKIKEFATGESFSGIREKSEERSTIPE